MANLTRPITQPITRPLTQKVTGAWKRGSTTPVVQLSATTVAEDAAINAVIGTLSVSNLGILTVTGYSIFADPDSKFNISVANLRTNAGLDYETKTSHSVTVRATLSDLSTFDGTFNITVTNVAAPSYTGLTSFTIAENSTAVGTLTASEASTFTISGTDAALFGVTGAALAFLVAPDYETPGDAGVNNVYNLTVRATSNATGEFVDTAITVTVTDVAEGGGTQAFIFNISSNSMYVPFLEDI